MDTVVIGAAAWCLMRHFHEPAPEPAAETAYTTTAPLRAEPPKPRACGYKGRAPVVKPYDVLQRIRLLPQHRAETCARACDAFEECRSWAFQAPACTLLYERVPSREALGSAYGFKNWAVETGGECVPLKNL